MEEILEDTLDSSVLGEEDDLEEEATTEVDKVLFELTDGKLGQAAGTDQLPDLVAPKAAEVDEDQEKEQENLERMQAALDGLLRG